MNNKILDYGIFYGLFITWFLLFLNGNGLLSNIPQENVNDIMIFLAIVCLICTHYFRKMLIKKGYNSNTLLAPSSIFLFIITMTMYIRYKFL
jgi:hypothetical protein